MNPVQMRKNSFGDFITVTYKIADNIEILTSTLGSALNIMF